MGSIWVDICSCWSFVIWPVKSWPQGTSDPGIIPQHAICMAANRKTPLEGDLSRALTVTKSGCHSCDRPQCTLLDCLAMARTEQVVDSEMPNLDSTARSNPVTVRTRPPCWLFLFPHFREAWSRVNCSGLLSEGTSALPSPEWTSETRTGGSARPQVFQGRRPAQEIP
jgi:hypothetical protein